MHNTNGKFLLRLHTLRCVLRPAWQNRGVKGRRAVWEKVLVDGRQNICNKQGDRWAKGVCREPSPKAIYSIAEPFLLTVGMWYSIVQCLGHL